MRRILFILMMLTVGAVVEAQTPYRGVDFTTLHLSPVDSALLRMNSVMYSGWDVDGVVTNSNATVYIKWAKNPEKYYPVMREAWKYCIDHAPYQVRLYKEGTRLFQDMIAVVKEDSVKKMKYCDELMKVYDKRIQNLDSINAYVKRVSDRSSRGNMMLYKAWTYDYFVLGNEQGVSEKSISIMYPKYKEAIGVVKQAFEEGLENAGDVDVDGLYRYFGYAAHKFFNTFNDAGQYEDSIRKKIRDNAKAVILDEYNFMKDFCYKQMESLGSDYIDTLSVEGGDSLDVVQEKVLMPYKNFMAFCDANMKGFNINVAIQKLEDAERVYGPDLEKNKNSLEWLTRVKKDCEQCLDCTPDNYLYYPFYEDIERLWDEAMSKPRPGPDPDNPTPKINRWAALAKPLYNRVVKFYNSGKGNMDNGTFDAALLCIHYYKKARGEDPGNMSSYNQKIKWLQSGVRSEAFFRTNVKRGQTYVVNGVSFVTDF